MAAELGGDVGAGIGTRLRTARERRGLTILQAAERIHSDPRVVEALESEDFPSLGAAVYARGHLRHYAEVLGEPIEELLELYANTSHAAPATPDLTQIPRGQPESNAGRLVVPTVALLVIIGVIGTVGWLVSLQAARQQPAPVEQGAAPEKLAATKPVSTKPVATAVKGESIAAPSAAGVATASPAEDRGATVATSGASSAAAAAATGGSTAPPPKPKEGQLKLIFNADSWAEVYDASGQRLFYDVGAAATAHTVKGIAPFRVVLGNASGVALEYNGRPAAIPNSTLPDGSAQFLINAHGRAVPAKPAANGD